jgi:hypothetical protein
VHHPKIQAASSEEPKILRFKTHQHAAPHKQQTKIHFISFHRLSSLVQSTKHTYYYQYPIQYPITDIMKLAIASLLVGSVASFTPSSFINGGGVSHKTSSSSSALDMKYKVAVVGGGPSGACAAEIFAQEKNIDTVFFERKMNNAKPCGGAIPLCMIGEFDIPESTVDRKVG